MRESAETSSSLGLREHVDRESRLKDTQGDALLRIVKMPGGKAATVQRVASMDLFRGVAILNIVLIHTVFWSGKSYVPDWMRNLSLMVDVPLFFFLAGWSAALRPANFRETFAGIAKLYVNFVLMAVMMWCGMALFYHHFASGGTVSDWLLFKEFESPLFAVALGSMWFLPNFIAVRMTAPLLAPLFAKWDNAFELMLILAAVCYLFAGLPGSDAAIYYRVTVRTFVFYSFFYYLGLGTAGKTLSGGRSLLFTGVLGAMMYGVVQAAGPNFCLQSYKFPPSFGYLIATMFGITWVLFLKSKEDFRRRFAEKTRAGRILSWSGKNSFALYFCQGFGSSLLYQPAGYLLSRGWSWPAVLAAMFAVNVAITFALALPFCWISKLITNRLFSRRVGKPTQLQSSEKPLVETSRAA